MTAPAEGFIDHSHSACEHVLERMAKLEAVVRYVKQYAPKGIPELEMLIAATEPGGGCD